MLASSPAQLRLVVAAGCLGAVALALRPPPPLDRLEAPPLPTVELTIVEPLADPSYLQKTPELWMRTGSEIVRAPAEDQIVASTYATSSLRGPLVGGERIAILTARSQVNVGDPVRVIHVRDVPVHGHEVFVMGPKAIHGEFVDGVEVTPPDPGPQSYDGVVLRSPAADFNYDITSYVFSTPGTHTIEWRDGNQISNMLVIEVVKPYVCRYPVRRLTAR